MLDGTRWATECRAHRSGSVPVVDVAAHRALCAFVADLVAAQVGGTPGPVVLDAVHDVSGGGLAVALAEMASAATVGCALDLDDPVELFHEAPSRMVVATADPEALAAAAGAAGVPCTVLGRAGGDRVVLGSLVDLALDTLREAHEGALPRALGES
jgi:phosphoribosylformylglycinamidine synthase